MQKTVVQANPRNTAKSILPNSKMKPTTSDRKCKLQGCENPARILWCSYRCRYRFRDLANKAKFKLEKRAVPKNPDDVYRFII